MAFPKWQSNEKSLKFNYQGIIFILNYCLFKNLTPQKVSVAVEQNKSIFHCHSTRSTFLTISLWHVISYFYLIFHLLPSLFFPPPLLRSFQMLLHKGNYWQHHRNIPCHWIFYDFLILLLNFFLYDVKNLLHITMLCT